MSKNGTRVSGYTVSTTEEMLEKTSAQMLMVEGGKNYNAPTPFEINGVCSSIFDDSVKQEGGMQFSATDQIGSPLIAFKRTEIERTGGFDNPLKDDNRPDSISETGIWSHSGKGNSEYHARIPIEILKRIENKWVPEIFAGGTGSYILNICGSTAQKQKLSAWISVMQGVCLNGIESEMILSKKDRAGHKNTKGLDVRAVIKEAIQISANNYHKYNMVTDQLKNAEVTPEKLAMFMHSAVMNDTLAGGNMKEVTGYFQGIENNRSWFDNHDLSGYRLYNACTLWGEKQNSIPTREKLARGIWWSLADSGILPLPDSCRYPTKHIMLRQPISDSGNVPESEILETVEAELVS
jgi:hypothetical protein